MKSLLTLLVSVTLYGQGIPFPGGGLTHAVGAAVPAIVQCVAGSSSDHLSITTGNGDNCAGMTTGATWNTTGATLIVCAASYFKSAVITAFTDSKSNTYTALTPQVSTTFNQAIKIYYVMNPTVGSSHTLTVTGGYVSLACAAFSGMVTASPFDVENKAENTSSNTIQPGSITPSVNGSLIIGAESNGNNRTFSSEDSGFTVADSNGGGGNSMPVGLSYFFQTTAAAINPTLTIQATALAIVTTTASFKP